MQRKFGSDGLACISVSADEKDDVPRALAFLKKINATTENYHLDEPGEIIEEKLGSTALPTVVVYGRDGKVAKTFLPAVDYDDVEKFTVDLLKK